MATGGGPLGVSAETGTTATAATAAKPGLTAAGSTTQTQTRSPTTVVGLHPLAIVGVSDHVTRVEVGGSKQDASMPILGLLFGKQDALGGGRVSISDAMEVTYEMVPSPNNAQEDPIVKLDEAFLLKQKELYTAVYEDRDLLGWYTVGERATARHLALHREFLKYNESPLFLLMDPSPSSDAKELPISIFEYELHMVNETPTMLFVPVPYQLETLQAEQIAMEQVAKTTSFGDPEQSMYESLDQSLKTLSNRVSRLIDYLRLVEAGKLPVDYALLRDVQAIADRVPGAALPSNKRADDDAILLRGQHRGTTSPDNNPLSTYAQRDYSDALAVSLLAGLTKNAKLVNDLTEKFNLIQAATTSGGLHGPGSVTKLA